MDATKKRILVFCDFYPPARGGGGMFAVANMIERLADRYEFFVVAGDRVERGKADLIDAEFRGRWLTNDDARVFFCDTSALSKEKIESILNEAQPDMVFLNSAFSRPARRFMNWRKHARERDLPVVIAPCGEFMPSALASKSLKKRLFLGYARASGLYRGAMWRASFEREAVAIRRTIGAAAEIMIAPDLPPKELLPEFDPSQKPDKLEGKLKLVFVARIVPVKNLHFLLECLRQIQTGEIDLEIIGPHEDRAYWSKCSALIELLPSNIKVNVTGSVDRAVALRALVNAHYFVLPTRGENFGYVVLEALAAGCPVIISDQTDWSDVEANGAGYVLNLNVAKDWADRLQKCLAMNGEDFRSSSISARRYAEQWLARPDNEQATARLFEAAIAADRR